MNETRQSAVNMFNGITDSDARFSRLNTALLQAYNGLGGLRTKVATMVMSRCIENQPKKKPSEERQKDIEKYDYLPYGRFADCFDVLDIMTSIYEPEEMNTKGKDAEIEKQLKALCEMNVLHRFIIRYGRISAKGYTYNRHVVQWFTKLILPCTIRFLSEPSAYKNACYVVALRMSEETSKDDDAWQPLEKGVYKAKVKYCEEFLWDFICRSHPDVKRGIPSFKDFGGSPDDYVKMVCERMGKFDPYYGVSLTPEFVSSMSLPASIKAPMLLAVKGELSASARGKFLHEYLYRYAELGGKNPPEIVWDEENSGGKNPPESGNSGGKNPPDFEEMPVSGGKNPPESASMGVVNHMNTNELEKTEIASLRVNEFNIEELQEDSDGKQGIRDREHGVAVMDHHDGQDGEDSDLDGSYNGGMKQEDQSLTSDQVNGESFNVPEFNPGGHRKHPKASKPKKEGLVPKQASLHAREMKKKRDSEKPVQTILNNASMFVDTFRRIVSEETGGRASFPKVERLGFEMESAKKMHDILVNEGCLSESVMLGWMRYSGGQFRKVRKTITVGMMKDTWAGYRKLRPTSKTGKPEATVPPPSTSDSIGSSMDMIFSSCPRHDAAWKACKSWGVVLTATWMSLSSKDPCAEVKDCLVAHMGSTIGQEDVRDILSSTSRWDVETSKYGLPMADWRVMLADIIGKVGPFHAFPSKRDDNEDVLVFVGNIRRGK